MAPHRFFLERESIQLAHKREPERHYYSTQPHSLIPKMDANHDETVMSDEMLGQSSGTWWWWSRHSTNLILGMVWTVLIVSIIPGRLHGWSGKVLKWPVLVLINVMIGIELLVYILIRLLIRVAEAMVATPKHRQLRRAMANAQSYSEWYNLAAALDESQNRHVWLLQPSSKKDQATKSYISAPTNRTANVKEAEEDWRQPPSLSPTSSLASSSSSEYGEGNLPKPPQQQRGMNDISERNTRRLDQNDEDKPTTWDDSSHYNWRLVQGLQTKLQLAPQQPKTLRTTAQLHHILAILQQCLRGPNVGGIMSSDLFSFSNTGQGQPK